MSSQPKARQEQKLKLAANMIYSRNDLYLWLYLHFSISILFSMLIPLKCVLFSRAATEMRDGGNEKALVNEVVISKASLALFNNNKLS